MPFIAALAAGIIVWLVFGESEGKPNYEGGCARVRLWTIVVAVGLGLFAVAWVK